MGVGGIIGEELAERPFAALNAIHKLADLVRKSTEVAQNFSAALDDLLDGLFFLALDLIAFLERRARKAAANGDVAIAQQAFGHQAGDGIGADFVLIFFVNPHYDFDIAPAVERLIWYARSDVDGIHVSNLEAVQAHGRASAQTFHLGEKSCQAILRAKNPRAGNVEDADGQEKQPHQDEQSNAQFVPRYLVAL